MDRVKAINPVTNKALAMAYKRFNYSKNKYVKKTWI